MSGCAGLGDYEIELVNGYAISKSAVGRVRIYPPEDITEDIYVPLSEDYEDGEYITQVGHDEERYIVAKTNRNLYYIVDTNDSILYGPLDKNEFDEKRNDLEIPSQVELKELDEYTRDHGWIEAEPQ